MKLSLNIIACATLIAGTVWQISVAHAVNISAVIPGSNTGGSGGTPGPADYIANFYQFALLIGGVLALAVVVYGGILYMTSIGNPSGMDEAKKWLEAALFGILLLAGAYLILNIINPQLVNLTLPALTNTGATTNQVGTSPGATTPQSGSASSPTTGASGGSVNGFQGSQGGSVGAKDATKS